MAFGMLEFYGTINGDKIDFPGQQTSLMKDYLSSTKDGTMVYVRIGRYSAPKTNAQLRAWFGLFLATVLAEFNDRGYDTSFLLNIDKPTGIPIDRDLLKDYMYNVCPVYNEEGRKIGMSSMNIEQMVKFFDDCRNFTASQWNIFVPEPDKDHKKKSISELRESLRNSNDGTD